jgi:hypothetical protein
MEDFMIDQLLRNSIAGETIRKQGRSADRQALYMFEGSSLP